MLSLRLLEHRNQGSSLSMLTTATHLLASQPGLAANTDVAAHPLRLVSGKSMWSSLNALAPAKAAMYGNVLSTPTNVDADGSYDPSLKQSSEILDP